MASPSPQNVKHLFSNFIFDKAVSSAQLPEECTSEKVTSLAQLRGRDSFQERVNTYKPMTWRARPLWLSPPCCARYGWVNVDADLLRCVSCHAFMAARMPANSDPHVYATCCQRLEDSLKTSHQQLCPWISYPCPETFLGPPLGTQAQMQLEMSRRIKAIRTLGEMEPLVHSDILNDMNLSLEDLQSLVLLLIDSSPSTNDIEMEHTDSDFAEALETLQRDEMPGDEPEECLNLTRDQMATVIALCGWNKQPGNVNQLYCDFCDRRVGLWNHHSYHSIAHPEIEVEEEEIIEHQQIEEHQSDKETEEETQEVIPSETLASDGVNKDELNDSVAIVTDIMSEIVDNVLNKVTKSVSKEDSPSTDSDDNKEDEADATIVRKVDMENVPNESALTDSKALNEESEESNDVTAIVTDIVSEIVSDVLGKVSDNVTGEDSNLDIEDVMEELLTKTVESEKNENSDDEMDEPSLSSKDTNDVVMDPLPDVVEDTDNETLMAQSHNDPCVESLTSEGSEDVHMKCTLTDGSVDSDEALLMPQVMNDPDPDPLMVDGSNDPRGDHLKSDDSDDDSSLDGSQSPNIEHLSSDGSVSDHSADSETSVNLEGGNSPSSEDESELKDISREEICIDVESDVEEYSGELPGGDQSESSASSQFYDAKENMESKDHDDSSNDCDVDVESMVENIVPDSDSIGDADSENNFEVYYMSSSNDENECNILEEDSDNFRECDDEDDSDNADKDSEHHSEDDLDMKSDGQYESNILNEASEVSANVDSMLDVEMGTMAHSSPSRDQMSEESEVPTLLEGSMPEQQYLGSHDGHAVDDIMMEVQESTELEESINRNQPVSDTDHQKSSSCEESVDERSADGESSLPSAPHDSDVDLSETASEPAFCQKSSNELIEQVVDNCANNETPMTNSENVLDELCQDDTSLVGLKSAKRKLSETEETLLNMSDQGSINDVATSMEVITQEPKKKKKKPKNLRSFFSPLKEHRPWCPCVFSLSVQPFQRCDSPKKNNSSSQPGWKKLIDLLLMTNSPEKSKMVQLSKTTPPHLTLRSIRHLLTEWTAHKS